MAVENEKRMELAYKSKRNGLSSMGEKKKDSSKGSSEGVKSGRVEKKKHNKDKQRSDNNKGNSAPKTKTGEKSEKQLSQTIKDARMAKGDCLNCGQAGHYAAKCQNKTAYYDTYKSKTDGKAASKDKGKGKGKAEEKKISNAIVAEEEAAVMFGKIWSLSEEEVEIDPEDYA
jgi:hypothetical protein